MNRKTMAILSYAFYFGIVVVIGLVIYFVASAIDKSSNKKPESEPDEVIVQPQIEVNRKNVSLKVGESTRVNVRVIDGDSNDLIFESSNPLVATVDGTGLIAGVSAGNCVISIKISETVSVNVDVVVESSNVLPTGVFVPESYVKGVIGGTYQIVPTVIPKTASDQNVLYKTSDSSIADVGTDGIISFKNVGKCKITVYLASNPSIETVIEVDVRKY